MNRYEPLVFVAVTANTAPSGTPSLLASWYRLTVTPAMPASVPSTLPLLFLSFHTKLPSDNDWKKPKSIDTRLSWSRAGSTMPGVKPFAPSSFVAAPPTVNVMRLLVTKPPLPRLPTVLPLSLLLPGKPTGGSNAFPTPVLLPNPASGPPALKLLAAIATL